MKSPIHRLPAMLTVVLAFALSSCHDVSRIMQVATGTVPRAVTPSTVITVSGSSAVVTLVLDTRGNVGKIGSFTGRLRFDPSALSYESEVALTDATLRASNPGIGVIRVAGVSTVGVDVTRLAAFRFTVKNAEGLSSVRFDVEELHELTHADLHADVRLSTAPKVLR